MTGLSVLITNIALDGRSGTEVVAADVARALASRGHRPVIYSPHLGDLAAALRGEGLRVVGSLEDQGLRPDIIHGQHNVTTVTAMVRFPRAPAVFVCHDAKAWHDEPPVLDRIRRYIAVDAACREQLAGCAGVPAERIGVLLNALDLARFRRRDKLPPRPERALVLTKNSGHLAAVREACRARAIALDELGPGTGRVVTDLERVLPDYDVVFATARMALESLAVGAAVVACDARGFAGLVTTRTLDAWRARNFGWSTLTTETTAERIGDALAVYDAADAALVTDRIRAEAGLDAHLDRLEAIYGDALASPIDGSSEAEEDERRAIAAFLARWLPDYRPPWPRQNEREALLAQAAGQADIIAQLNARLAAQLAAQTEIVAQLTAQVAAQTAQVAAQVAAVAQLRAQASSPRWLVRQMFRALKGKPPR